MNLTTFRRKTMRLRRPRLHGAAILLVAACTITALAQTAATKLPADINPDSRARLPYLQRKNLDEAGQKIFDVLPGRSPDGVLSGPLAFAAYNPAVAKALFDLHNAAVAGTLNAHVRELAIMVACRETNYNLEWNGHEATALRSGVDAKVIDIVRRGAPLTGIGDEDATVIRFGRQLYTDKKVDSATFAKAVEHFGQRGVMDMVAVMNTYAVSGFYGIAVDEQAAAGKTPLEQIKR
jgi:4-carboxymuconolactone decarboxylase